MEIFKTYSLEMTQISVASCITFYTLKIPIHRRVVGIIALVCKRGQVGIALVCNESGRNQRL
jgi:hypothetical protein